MTLLPRSLLARTFLFIAGLVIVSMAAWIAIFTVAEFEPRARQLSRMVVSIVNLTRTALVTADPSLRRELLFDLSIREGIRIYAAEPGEKLRPLEPNRLLDRVISLTREELGVHTRFAAAREGTAGFWVSFTIDDDEYWIVMDSSRIERRLTAQWLFWMALALVLALAGAYAIVYRVKKPLTALAGAAREVGQGKHPEPLPEDGPDELRTMAHAFNQMTDDLRRLDRDRALVLAGVSHDLRTPLARLRLGIELSGADQPTRDGMAADIDEMDRIIGQFLDFARVESSEALAAVDLAALGHELVRQYRDRGMALDAAIEATPTVPVRPLAIRRLIINLIDNAFRYAGAGVSLAIKPAGNKIEIAVLDRGPGIPPAEVERLKQPFQRLETARSNAGGSGLGLAIVERIARMHDSTLELLPREDGGLRARVLLRRA